MKKRGQIALFIIVGIVLIIGASFTVYLLNKNRQQDTIELIETQVVTQDLMPIKNRVESCIYFVSKEGLQIIGRNGGYINQHYMNIKLSPVSYQSEGLEFGDEILPYWRHIDKNNFIAYKIPPLSKSNGPNSVEAQLEFYVNSNLLKCLGNMSEFEGYEIILGKPVSEAIITKEDVIVSLDLPTSITDQNGQKTLLKQYSKKIDLNFRQIYDFAVELVENEANYTFIENTVLNTISAYGGLDESALPPLSDPIVLGSDSTTWLEYEVKQKVQYDVLDFINAMQVINAANYMPYSGDNQLQIGMHSTYNVQFASEKSYNITASFINPGKDIYFEMGQKFITSKSMVPWWFFFFKLIPGFDIRKYDYSYDISFPVIVRLGDPKAFNYEGYDFNFAIEGNIRNSLPVNSSFNFNPLSLEYGLAMDKGSQYLNKTIKFNIINRRSKESLEHAEIKYSCGQEFFIAMTDDKGEASAKMPYCAYGGNVIVRKQGYASVKLPFNNNKDDGKEIAIDAELWPKINKTIKVMKRDIDDIGNIQKKGRMLSLQSFDELLSNNSRNLSVWDKVFFIIQNNETEDPVPLVGFIKLDGNASVPVIDIGTIKKQLESAKDMTQKDKDDYLAKMTELSKQPPSPFELSNVRELVPGDYEISATLLDYSGMFIGKSFRCDEGDSCVRRNIQKIPIEMSVLKDIGVKDLSSYFIDPTTSKNLSLEYFDEIGTCKKKTFISFDSCDEPEILDRIWAPIWYSGGLESTTITLTEEQIYGTDSITFYVIELPKPDSYEYLMDQDNRHTLEDYQIPYLIKPLAR